MAPIGSRKEFFYWVAAAAVATACLTLIVTSGRRRESARTALQVAGNPDKGAELFFGSKRCSVCHAVDGKGGRIAWDLRGRPPGNPAMGWMTSVLWNHAPGMWRKIRTSNQSYPQLDQQEMADMLAFLYQAANTDKPGDVEAGKRVFEEKGCIRCHAVNGAGGARGPDLSALLAAHNPNAWITTMWNHAQGMAEPVMQSLGNWPQFDGKSMNNLVAYAASGAPKSSQPQVANTTAPLTRGNAELGWKAFEAKCIQCHSVRGQGGKAGPGLGPESQLPLTTSQFAALLWNHAPAMLASVKSNSQTLPKLEGDDIVHLTAFLASLRYVEPTGSALVGAKVFSDRGCASCHGEKGEGGFGFVRHGFVAARSPNARQGARGRREMAGPGTDRRG
jgi:cytochrome c